MAPKARPAAKGKAKAKAMVVRPRRADRGRVTLDGRRGDQGVGNPNRARWGWDNDRGDRWKLLRVSLQGSRTAPVDRCTTGCGALPSQVDGHHQRGVAEAPDWKPLAIGEGPPLPERLHSRTHGRGPPPRLQDEEARLGPPGGGVGQEFGGCGRRRRVRSPQITGRSPRSCRPRERGSCREEGRQGQEDREEPEQKKEEGQGQEEVQEIKEKEERVRAQCQHGRTWPQEGKRGGGQEAPEIIDLEQPVSTTDWQVSSCGLNKVVRSSLFGDRPGQERADQTTCSEEGQTGGSQKDQGEVVGRERQLLGSEWVGFGSRGRGHVVRGRDQGAADRSAVPRGTSLSSIGHDAFQPPARSGSPSEGGSLEPIALMYMRQHLVKKANGPALREILTLSIAVDQLLNSRPARALDTLLQRLKSVEAGLNGAHWSVAQKLEVGPTENLMLTAQEELSSAQKEAYTDARTKMLAGLSEGRPKGYAKGSSKNKDDGRRDRDRPKGKDSGKGKSKSSNKEEQASK